MQKRTLIFICVCICVWVTGCSTAGTAQRSENEPVEGAATHADPGSLELPYMARPFPGIITAGQLTPAQFDRLDEAGVGAVINLRAADEPDAWDEQTRAEELSLNYVNLPITVPEDLTRDRVDAFDETLNATTEEAQGSVLVHCSTSNRVGALFALRAYWIEGKSVEEAIAIGRAAGLTKLEDMVRQKMAE